MRVCKNIAKSSNKPLNTKYEPADDDAAVRKTGEFVDKNNIHKITKLKSHHHVFTQLKDKDNNINNLILPEIPKLKESIKLTLRKEKRIKHEQDKLKTNYIIPLLSHPINTHNNNLKSHIDFTPKASNTTQSTRITTQTHT